MKKKPAEPMRLFVALALSQPMIEEAIAGLMDTYHIDHTEADLLHDQLWMHAHGIASMIATNFCDWNMEKVERMLSDSRHAFTQKYEA